MAKLRPSGGYRKSCSFQTATIIYDATYWFCEKFLDPRSRTVDQMVQGGRSGRQNIAEGSRAAATSSQTELRLVNAARFSLEELLLDFEDYLRHRHLTQWEPDSPEALAVRRVPQKFKQDRSDQSDLTDLTDQERWALYAPWLDHADPAVRANAVICLIHQANYLLDQQIEALEKKFVEEGGYSEQLAAARLAERNRRKTFKTDSTDQPDRSDPTDQIPDCPACGRPMVLRTAKTGKNAGNQFWGCSAYPDCRGVVNL
ncbi:MAG: topoisomerase DNA-binding C4 zinc finger domain-containing protein [Kiritimatiellae bacterium]|nr:topoisomerase DNA-binding C4 zinc finger domain-containing protein [Kiritimatiellia bacterium]